MLMLFLHVADDWHLQGNGILALMKQKSWWQEHAPDPMYRHDYLMALAMHSLSWAFLIMLPIAVAKGFDVGIWFAVVFIWNAAVHGIIDDLKANRKKIDLVFDQTFHLIQIGATAALYLKGLI